MLCDERTDLDSTASQPPIAISGRPGYVLVLMACLTALNVMDRQLLSVLIDPIKQEFGVSDRAMGLLTGTAFALLHGTAGIPIAVAADRGVRRTIIAVGLAVWSGLTFMTGLARSYTEIFAIRVCVGIGEAASSAPAQSLLSDVFPPARRATALSILTLGGPLGSILVFALGGWLADVYGWRVAFMVFGAPGLVLALLIRLTVPEPERGAFDARPLVTAAPPPQHGPRSGAEASAPIPFGSAVRFLFVVPSIRTVFFASGLHSVGMYAVLGWSVPYLMRVHHLSTGEAGARLAVASALITALGALAGGALADRLAARDLRWLVWLPGIALSLAFPFAQGFALAPTAKVAILLLVPVSLLTGSCFGPFYSVLQTLAPPRMRALAAALVLSFNTLFGLGLAPPIIGWLNDAGAARWGAESIRYSLCAALGAHLVAALCLARAGRTLRRDLAAKDAWTSPATPAHLGATLLGLPDPDPQVSRGRHGT
jgi:MFS family permease